MDCLLKKNEVIRLSVMPTHDAYLDNGTATELIADTLNIPLQRAIVKKMLLISCIQSTNKASNY